MNILSSLAGIFVGWSCVVLANRLNIVYTSQPHTTHCFTCILIHTHTPSQRIGEHALEFSGWGEWWRKLAQPNESKNENWQQFFVTLLLAIAVLSSHNRLPKNRQLGGNVLLKLSHSLYWNEKWANRAKLNSNNNNNLHHCRCHYQSFRSCNSHEEKYSKNP